MIGDDRRTFTPGAGALRLRRAVSPAATMRKSTAFALIALAACLEAARGCEPGDKVNGCKILGSSCSCGFGCKHEYVFRKRRDCMNALQGRNTNACSRRPCISGICIQTVLDPGFACKCEGTGFYGQRCEKACPTIPMRGLVFPHECVII